jgi:DNA-binding transcriptional regulator YiaG
MPDINPIAVNQSNRKPSAHAKPSPRRSERWEENSPTKSSRIEPLNHREAAFAEIRRTYVLSAGESSPAGYCTADNSGKYAGDIKRQKDDKTLNTNIKTIGGWLKAKRIGKNLTPHHLAERMGITSLRVSAWETNLERPTPEEVVVLAKILNSEISEANRTELMK